MDQFNNVDLEFANFEDYVEFEFSDFEDEEQQTVPENPPRRNTYNTDSDSDCEDDFQTSNVKTDTSAFEARNGKDIQGIPWEKLNYSRDEYRETRLKQYKNYECLTRSREDLDKECLEVEKGNSFYDFQFNTRLVKSTIAHFQDGFRGGPLYIRI